MGTSHIPMMQCYQKTLSAILKCKSWLPRGSATRDLLSFKNMDIRAFLAMSKSSESSQTSTASTSKRAIDDSSTSQSSLKREFVRSWLKDFKWLTYDLEGNRMFCKVCRDNPTSSDSPSCLAVRTWPCTMNFIFSCIINWLQFDSNSSLTFSRVFLISKKW